MKREIKISTPIRFALSIFIIHEKKFFGNFFCEMDIYKYGNNHLWTINELSLRKMDQ